MIILMECGRLRPFIGDNAVDHYLPIAHRLATEGRFNGPDSRPDSKVPIGYPALLAVAHRLSPATYLGIAICVQAVGEFLGAAALYWLARQLGSPGAGLVAGLLWLVFPPALVIDTWITAEPVFTVLLVVSIAVLVYGLSNGSLGGSLLAGAILGAATLFRGTCLFLPIALLPVWVSPKVSRSVAHGVMFTLGLALVVAPWTIRNKLVLDDPIVVSVGFGSAFHQGSDPRFLTIAGKEKYYPIVTKEAEEAGVVKPTGRKESDIDHWLFRLGLYSYRQEAKHPLALVRFVVLKFFRLWYGVESGRRMPQLFLGVCSLAVVPLGIIQFIRWCSTKPIAGWVLTLLLAYFVLLHWVSLPEYRYVYPIMPFLILGAVAYLGSLFTPAPMAGETHAGVSDIV